MLSTTSELDSDDSLYKYRRKTRRQRVSSSFSSDSDDSVVAQPHRRKKCRVSSSSSGSDDSLLARPSRKKCKVLSDSESESTSSSDSEEDKSLRRRHDKGPNKHAISSSEPTPEKKGSSEAQIPVSLSSDSDEGEKCIICFKTLNPPFAHPSNCSHHFHPNCLATWTKTSNTCPIDRNLYTSIIVVDHNGDIISRESVTTPPPQDHNADFEPDDATFCEVCSQHDREHEMLLCDRCEAGYHLDCLTPPLREVPDGTWYCPRCTDPNNELAEELNELMDDASIILETRMRQRPTTTSTRMPSRPRTRGAQRVFNIIHHQQTSDQPSTSSVTIRRHRPSSHRTRRSKSSRAPQSTRYKVELITVEDGTTLEVKVAVNTRSRTKSKKHSRRKSKKKCSKSSQRSGGPSTSRDTIFTGEGPSHSLDLLGSRPQLDYFSGCEAEDELDDDGGRGGGVGVLHLGSRPGVRNMASRKQIAAQILSARPRRPPPRIEVSRAPVDLVSSIIEQQEKWHNPRASYESTSTGDIRVIMKESSSRMRQAGGSSGGSSGPSTSSQTPSSSGQPSRDRPSSSGNGNRFNDTNPRQSSASSSGTSERGEDLSKTSGSSEQVPSSEVNRGDNDSDKDSEGRETKGEQDSNNSSPSSFEIKERERNFNPRKCPVQCNDSDDSDNDYKTPTGDGSSYSTADTLDDQRVPEDLSMKKPERNNESDVEKVQDNASKENLDAEMDQVESGYGVDDQKKREDINDEPEDLSKVDDKSQGEQEYGRVEDVAGRKENEGKHDECNTNSGDIVDSKEVIEESKEVTNESKEVIDESKEVSEESKEVTDESKEVTEESKEVTDESKEVSEESKEVTDESIVEKQDISAEKSNIIRPEEDDQEYSYVKVCSSKYDVQEEDHKLEDVTEREAHGNEDVLHKVSCSDKGKETSEGTTIETEVGAREDELDDKSNGSDATNKKVSDEGKITTSVSKIDDETPDFANNSAAEDSPGELSDGELTDKLTGQHPLKEDAVTSLPSEATFDEPLCKDDANIASDEGVLFPSPSNDNQETISEYDSLGSKFGVNDKEIDLEEISSRSDTIVDEPRCKNDANNASDEGFAFPSPGNDDNQGMLPQCDSLGPKVGVDDQEADVRGQVEVDSSANRSNLENEAEARCEQGGDLLEIGCDEEKDGLVDITDEEISSYERSWEMEENGEKSKKEGLEGLDTEAISDCEYQPVDSDATQKKDVEESTELQPLNEAIEEVSKDREEEGEIVTEEGSPMQRKKIPKERNYRGDPKTTKTKEKNKAPIHKNDKQSELERYDARRVITEKPRKKSGEFGEDISSDSESTSLSSSIGRSISREKMSRSESRSRSRARKERLRDRARDRSRERSKSRSRERNKVRSMSREMNRRNRSRDRQSRSRSRKRRRSRTPRRERGRSRDRGSRDKKKRKRSPSSSCSSCSCSSCERGKKRDKKLTVVVPNEGKARDRSRERGKTKKDKRRSRSRNRKRKTPVPSKEVFTSGNNILVSVNFKSSNAEESARTAAAPSSKRKRDDEGRKKKDKRTKENQPLRSIVTKKNPSRKKLNTSHMKPVAIIDLDASPFRETTLSPKEVIILTDSDDEDKLAKTDSVILLSGPKTPPEPHIKFSITNNSKQQQQLRGITNPLVDKTGREDDDVMHIGPNTPPEPSAPYDPFEPTKSRSPSPGTARLDGMPSPLQDAKQRPTPLQPQSMTPPKSSQHDSPKTPSPLQSKPKEIDDTEKNKQLPFQPVDLDSGDDSGGGGDSPYSPGSSEADDLFEPPMVQSASAPKLRPRPAAAIQGNKAKVPPPKSTQKRSNNLKDASKKAAVKKDIGMKLDEDQLKILDDLPNSAVEMQVKDKFLKKLNRQERVVEEVKLVLKPHYAKKHVTKEEYKEILRRSVPKICHSRSGEINPLKIQRLIEAYVKKYRHRMKRKTGAPTIPPLRQNKPVVVKTQWA